MYDIKTDIKKLFHEDIATKSKTRYLKDIRTFEKEEERESMALGRIKWDEPESTFMIIEYREPEETFYKMKWLAGRLEKETAWGEEFHKRAKILYQQEYHERIISTKLPSTSLYPHTRSLWEEEVIFSMLEYHQDIFDTLKQKLEKPIEKPHARIEKIVLHIIDGFKEDINFKSKNEILEPLNLIEILRIKKLARISERYDIIRELDSVMEKYFEGIPTVIEIEEEKDIIQKDKRKHLTIDEAEEKIKKALSILDEFEKKHKTKVSDYVVKYSVKRVLERIKISD